MKKFFFYNIVLPLSPTISWILSDKKKKKFLRWILDRNNEFVLNNIKKPQKVIILLPRCLQNSECKNNIISSIENCKKCGKCKVKDLVEIKHTLDTSVEIDVKTATGGRIAKLHIEEYKPDYVIAVACDKELIEGIKESRDYKILAISNIITEKPCVNTDVDIERIKHFLNMIIK